MYTSGAWSFNDRSPELVRAIEDFSHGGSVLILGCGTASIVTHVKPEAYAYLLGVDYSREAVSRANEQSNAKTHFEVGDMRTYQCQRAFDVILFPESLYYLNASEQETLLKRLCDALTPDGAIIVTLCFEDRYSEMIKMLRGKFSVIREGPCQGIKRGFIAIRPVPPAPSSPQRASAVSTN
jgi:trans-aconitate methyltransferase